VSNLSNVQLRKWRDGCGVVAGDAGAGAECGDGEGAAGEIHFRSDEGPARGMTTAGFIIIQTYNRQPKCIGSDNRLRARMAVPKTTVSQNGRA